MPRLPPEIVDERRWRTVIQGEWSYDEHIMVQEGRATLLCLRREARNVGSHGTLIGVLSDNLSSTLAFDKGRSSNFALLSLCRRAAALTIGCRFRFRIRYVETDRNAADKGSREGGRIVRPHSRAQAIRHRREAAVPRRVLCLAELISPPVLAPAPPVFPAAPPVARPRAVAQPVAAPTPPPRESRSSVAVAPAPVRAAKPPKPVAQPKAKLLGPRLRSIWEGAPERVPVPDLPRLPRSARRLVEKAKGCVRQKRMSCAACPAFLELFAGSARFTSAMIERRFRVLPAFELLDCQAYDLSSPSVQCLILCWLLSGRVWFVHLAPPCKDFSVAKSTGEISEMSRSFVLFSCVIISVCLQNNIGFSFENPRGSSMWKDPLLSQFLGLSSVHCVEIDHCQYNCLYKKPTSFYTNFEPLLALARKCDHRSHALVLEGRVQCRAPRDSAAKWHWKTSLASPYPVSLMRHAAEILEKEGPRLARQTRGEVEAGRGAHSEVVRAFELGQCRAERGERELKEANGQWPPVMPVVVPLPARERRPWPSDAKQWGRHAGQ